MSAFVQLRPVLLGTVVAVAALLMAVLAAGPAVRALAGPPAGFGSDYTSAAAYLQATVAQCVSLALSYLLFGWATRSRAIPGGWKWALWAANPLTVGLAYLLFRLSGPDDWPYEYTAYHGWLLLALAAPLLFAPCVYFGARMVRRQL